MSDDLTELYIKQQLAKEGVHYSLPGENTSKSPRALWDYPATR